MLTFLAILLTGYCGLAAHWYNRYAQGRTDSTFLEYLNTYRNRTISSCLSILASEIALFQGSPVELTMQTIFAAFTYGYTIDSIMNRGKEGMPAEPEPTFQAGIDPKNPAVRPPLEETSVAAKVRTPAKKPLQDLINETKER